jgi:hypothetical protein
MMDRRVMHWMMNHMVTVMDDTPVVHRMMDLRRCKAGHNQKEGCCH